MKSRLQEEYNTTLKEVLVKKLSIKNTMQIPKILKIVINIGVKDAVGDSKVLESVQQIISKISGQKAIKTKARKSVASFKLRQGMLIGVAVTLRGHKMYSFLDRFINLALPCVRDFQGVSTSGFDGHGNFNIGVRDWMIFPEIDYDEVDKSRGLNITIHTSAVCDEDAFELLKCFRMPFGQR